MKWQIRPALRRLCAKLSAALCLRRRHSTSTKNSASSNLSSGEKLELADMISDMRPPSDLEYHSDMMGEAIREAELALATDEVPVGCIFVYRNQIIGRGRNDTNRSLCGTRHAEFIAMEQILRTYPPATFEETDLYVTVEPCIMCASALRQMKIRRVFFGAMNDRFGGCGGVMKVHEDKNVDSAGYKVYGGIRYDEAIMLLRRFYIQENGRAPKPLEKRTRQLKFEVAPFGEGSGALAVTQAARKTEAKQPSVRTA